MGKASLKPEVSSHKCSESIIFRGLKVFSRIITIDMVVILFTDIPLQGVSSKIR